MIDRTWTGAVSNDASNPLNWSPSDSAPQPGDTLSATAGYPFTMDIRGDALAGDTLHISSPPYYLPNTFNLSDSANATIAFGPYENSDVVNVSGRDTLNVPLQESLDRLTINLAANANLFGTLSESRYASITMTDGGNGRYHNDGTDTFRGATVAIQPGVVGSGMFFVSDGPDASTGSLQFGGSVSGGQTVEVIGGTYPFPLIRTSKLTVDDPSQFQATVDLHNLSLADFVGLAQVDSWSYKNDLLSLSNVSGQVIDKFHIVSDAPSTGDVHGLSVSKSAAGDVLVSPGTDFKGSLALPTS